MRNEVKRIRVYMSKAEVDFFNSIDINPIHKSSPESRIGIKGCVSGLYLISIVNILSWSDNVYCATDIKINFVNAIFPTDIIYLDLVICQKGKKRVVNFSFVRSEKIVCKGKIKQITYEVQAKTTPRAECV